MHFSPFSRVGGTELHLRDLLRALALPRALVAYPCRREMVVAEVFHGDVQTPFFYKFDLRAPTEGICITHSEISDLVRHWIDLFAISGVHTHHLLGWPIELGRVLTELRVPYIYTSHDYYAVCPNWFLFDYQLNAACPCDWKNPFDPGCLPSFAAQGGLELQTELGKLRSAHRRAFQQFAAGAKVMVFPSNAARQRVTRALGVNAESTEVIEHGSDVTLHAARARPAAKLRLAVVGNIAAPIKGKENYRELIERTSDLPIEWHFFGESPITRVEEFRPKARVRLHGAYRREDIADQLATCGIDLVVILPKVEETFSYVLSESVAAGIPVLANGRGSLLERLEQSGAGVVVKDLDEAYRWLGRACESRHDLEKLAERARAAAPVTTAENAQAYMTIYRRCNLLDGDLALVPVPEPSRRELLARSTTVDPAAPILEPPPQYQKSWWYPAFRAVKWLIPAPLRALGRRVMVRRERAL